MNSISTFLAKKKKKKIRNDVITLNEKGRLINNEFEVAETLYSHYDIALVDAIISNYENHSSIDQVRKKCSNPKK